MFYNEEKSLQDISKELGFEKAEGVRQIKKKIIDAFLSGSTICHNLRLNRDLLDVLRSARENCFYKDVRFIGDFIGQSVDDEKLKDVLSCDIVDIWEVMYIKIMCIAILRHKSRLQITIII